MGEEGGKKKHNRHLALSGKRPQTWPGPRWGRPMRRLKNTLIYVEDREVMQTGRPTAWQFLEWDRLAAALDEAHTLMTRR